MLNRMRSFICMRTDISILFVKIRKINCTKNQVANSLQYAMQMDLCLSSVENTRVVCLLVYFSCFAIVVVDIILAHYFDVVRHILVPTEK
jgi:hypothetical protein